MRCVTVSPIFSVIGGGKYHLETIQIEHTNSLTTMGALAHLERQGFFPIPCIPGWSAALPFYSVVSLSPSFSYENREMQRCPLAGTILWHGGDFNR